MKTKWLFTILMMIILLSQINGFAAASENSKEEDLRFRVLANSDTEDDQLTKQAVYYLMQQEILSTLASEKLWEKESLIKEIEKHIPQWQAKVEQALLAREEPYHATVRFEQHAFPVKQTEGEQYPAGVFDTIVITLGEGKGENWWCSIFPSFCEKVLISKEDQEKPIKEKSCKTNLSPEVETTAATIKVDSYIVKWFQKGWNWISKE
ncbi:stage II sporulation protein R [Jeotgalibacillus soli]|uniref:Stage II sporulation protein R n=1 Tax=Jeotgalibacillus soli TaxID=889306 RepID=A0A0C2RHV5_9BACL|nr:stage II sporulation protein R [Jeotgalibacillus soli]KIL49755.1 hypothetical protein KP78_12230 [Jeotgalibacillus soli]